MFSGDRDFRSTFSGDQTLAASSSSCNYSGFSTPFFNSSSAYVPQFMGNPLPQSIVFNSPPVVNHEIHVLPQIPAISAAPLDPLLAESDGFKTGSWLSGPSQSIVLLQPVTQLSNRPSQSTESCVLTRIGM